MLYMQDDRSYYLIKLFVYIIILFKKNLLLFLILIYIIFNL